METITKICTECKEEKNITLFAKNKSSKSGYGSLCKICKNKKQREWRKNNPELFKAQYERSKEKQREWYNKWRKTEKGRKALRKHSVKYVNKPENRDRILKYHKDYYNNNTEYFRNYHIDNREKLKNRSKEYYYNVSRKETTHFLSTKSIIYKLEKDGIDTSIFQLKSTHNLRLFYKDTSHRLHREKIKSIPLTDYDIIKGKILNIIGL